MSLEDGMAQTMNVAAEGLDDAYVLIAFETVGDQFRVWTGEGYDINITKLEAAAHTLLSRMLNIELGRSDACARCERCLSRAERVRAALAALGCGDPNSEIAIGAVH